MKTIEVTAGDSNPEGHYQRIEILEEVRQNLIDQELYAAVEYVDHSINFHKECIIAQAGW